MSWKSIADWTKERPAMLRLADRLGRSHGRLRLLDHLSPAPRPMLKPDLRDWKKKEFAAVWIGHATVLLRLGQTTILTDPVFSDRIGVGLGLMTAGPRRLIGPALTARELPPIDLILISHAHFDHLDRPSLVRLPRKIPVVTADQTADLITDLGYRRVRELRWGEQLNLPNGMRITARPVAHWGARTFYDRHRGYNGYLIETEKRRVLYGGDTAYHEGFKDIGKVDLAIFGIGAYQPYVASHATPEQALRMADHVRADFILPMHHRTFRLSYEPPLEPMERLLDATGRNAERVIVREVGGQWAEN